jgi:CRISPR/Cas system Type II protein with McrA/HNH and RuvC-like nuclease domain
MLPILIILIGIILIILNIKAIKKEDKSFEKILKREEVNNNRDYDLEIISIRKDLAETILDLQKEIEELKISINDIKNSTLMDDNKNNIENYTEESSDKRINEDIISEINFSNKVNLENNKLEKVRKLLENGLTDDKICEELSIGKGEVLLIKSLLKN